MVLTTVCFTVGDATNDDLLRVTGDSHGAEQTGSLTAIIVLQGSCIS